MPIRALAAALILLIPATATAQTPLPRLEPHGEAVHLIVDDAPFLVLGGELGNSTASDLDHLATHWDTLVALNLNTVLVPVYWELIEPEEGRFDFASVDGLLAQARHHDMRLVLLWFASWKNSMSSYAPSWVKRDADRFPRARGEDGQAQEILTPFSADNLDADRAAFTALMAHLARTDPERTVIMVQVENEIGMLPDARDHSDLANAAFADPVPAELMTYLTDNRDSLHPDLRAHWRGRDFPEEGGWTDVFGEGDHTDEIFMAWAFARYVDAIAEAGKAELDLPLFVNAALNDAGVAPGDYPSAGPLPHLFDIWKAGAPFIDFLAPDIYRPNYIERISEFRRADNPVFIPEANRAGRPEAAADALWSYGTMDAIGFSPFAIEDVSEPETDRLAQLNARLAEIAPLILDHQGHGTMTGFRPAVAADGSVDDAPIEITLGDTIFTIAFIDPWTPREDQYTSGHGGLIIQLGEAEYLVAGSGVTLTFAPADASDVRVGIDRIEEGRYEDGRWIAGRTLNGDQNHQGRHLRLPPDRIGMQRLTLYTYE